MKIAEYKIAPAPTFVIPPDEERKNIKVGQYAKLVFLDGKIPERMWVKVSLVVNNNYMGTLANDPVCSDLKFGDKITFKWFHVIDIME